MERSEKKGGEVPQFTFMATLLTPCSVLSIKCLQRRRALRCVLTARVNARGRSQMYPLFLGEVALGLGLD